MKTVVVLQPQYFPWRGVFEQIRLADVYVHFDDVQFPQGRSFTSRVQVKAAHGPQWLTVPVSREGRTTIAQTRIDNSRDWRVEHLRSLEHAYARAPHRDSMLDIARAVLSGEPPGSLCELTIRSVELSAKYLRLSPEFRRSSEVPSSKSASDRLVEICLRHGATRYVTGHGALRYLDETAFSLAGISVEVMAYRLNPYPQQHGSFDPYVSILDTIANLGEGAAGALDSEAESWSAAVARVHPE